MLAQGPNLTPIATSAVGRIYNFWAPSKAHFKLFFLGTYFLHVLFLAREISKENFIAVDHFFPQLS